VAPGELVTVVGPNGAGKTTLLRAIIGLVPVREGTIVFEGEPLTGHPTESIVRRGITLVPEERELFGPLSVRDNLRLGAYPLGRRSRRARFASGLERALALFPALRPRLGQAAATLSGGEQQMLALARALMAEPRLLLLDEPSMGLAPLVIREIYRALAALRRDGLTILLVEQNARAAFRIADRGYALGPGQPATEVAPGAQTADPTRRAYGLAVERGEVTP
jgi:branched-chain amino acid transport system ATP-binding protein